MSILWLLLEQSIRQVARGIHTSFLLLTALGKSRFQLFRRRFKGEPKIIISVGEETSSALLSLYADTYMSDARMGMMAQLAVPITLAYRDPSPASRIFFSVALDTRDIPSLPFKNYTLKVEVRVNTAEKEYAFSYHLPIEGPYAGEWDSGVYGNLTRFWADNIVDLEKPCVVRSVSFQIMLSDGQSSTHDAIYDLARPCVSLPQLRPAAKTIETRRSIIILSFDSLIDHAFLIERFGKGRFFDEAFQTILGEFQQGVGGIAQSDWTLPSVTSELFGLYPIQHGLTDPAVLKTIHRYSGPSLATVTKSAGFLTFGGTYSHKASTNLGFAAGFDCYENSARSLGFIDPIPDCNWAMRKLEKFDQDDIFIFLHTDFLHSPYYTISGRNGRNIPAHFPDFEHGNLKNPEIFYGRNVRLAYLQIFDLIQYLKVSKQFDNTMLVVVADHGFDLDHWTLRKKDYPLRESRIRVPFMVHWPRWSPEHVHNGGTRLNVLKEANTGIFRDVCAALDYDLPEVLRKLYPYRTRQQEYCISETIDHPKREDYMLALRGVEEKCVVRGRMDWKRMTVEELDDIYLFDPSKECLRLDDNPKAFGARATFFRDLALQHIETSLRFRREELPKLLHATAEDGS